MNRLFSTNFLIMFGFFKGRINSSRSWRLALMVSVLVASACTPEKKPSAERTEPWLRDDPKGRTQTTSTKTKYIVGAGANLELTVPSRRTKPQGTIQGISGHIILDAEQLQFVQGTIDIDLLQLKMDDQLALPPSDQLKKVLTPSLEKRLTEQSWSEQAYNWLGLGSNVSTRTQLARATFSIESAKELSHPRASLGATRQVTTSNEAEVLKDSGQTSRIVNATVVGRLTLRNISVARFLRVQINFIYDGAPSEGVPSAIVITLREPFSVPLAEYDIRPRDRAGHHISELNEIVGYLLGNTALIQGSITLTKAALD